MAIRRTVVTPIVVANLVVSLAVVGFALAVLPVQFERWQYYVGMDSWALAQRLFHSVYQFGPWITAALLVWGIALVRKSTCTLRHLAVYASCGLSISMLWLLWTLTVLAGFFELGMPA